MPNVGLATFEQDMTHEVAQLQAALQRTVNDSLDAMRQPVPGGTNGAGGLGRQPSNSAAGAPLVGHGVPSTARLPADCR